MTAPPPAGREQGAARYASPRVLLERYGLRAKKSWGQNFLADEGILDGIATLAVAAPGATVVELGSGLGHLTARLVAHGARVVAVERDRDMARVLRGELGDRIELLETDAVRLDYGALARSLAAPDAPAPSRLAVVGNLPYHLTSPILFSILDQRDAVSRAVFLVQLEVAERLAADPGTKDWGLLSVLLQQCAQVSVVRKVPAGAFHPPPRVESAVVLIDFGDVAHPARDPERFRALVKAGFAQRRKVLENALAASRVGTPEEIAAALAAAGIDGRRRGETLTVEEWSRLERSFAG